MTVRAIVFCSIVAFATGQASAEWVLLSDFDSLNTGTLGNQGGWTAAPDDIYQVTADPDNPANQAVQISSDGGNASIALGGGIAEGDTSTLFFRARNGNPGDLVFGSSGVAAPAAWGDSKDMCALQLATWTCGTAADLPMAERTRPTHGPTSG